MSLASGGLRLRLIRPTTVLLEAEEARAAFYRGRLVLESRVGPMLAGLIS